MKGKLEERARELFRNIGGGIGYSAEDLQAVIAFGAEARLEEAKYIKETVQEAFNHQSEAGPTEKRVAFSWVLARCRERIIALARAVHPAKSIFSSPDGTGNDFDIEAAADNIVSGRSV
jgi:hypothetical protein